MAPRTLPLASAVPQGTGLIGLTEIVYTEPEAGRFLKLSPVTLRSWRNRRKGGPRFVRLGRKIRYRRSDLEDFLARSVVDFAAPKKGKK
jgi:hypothetical protein